MADKLNERPLHKPVPGEPELGSPGDFVALSAAGTLLAALVLAAAYALFDGPVYGQVVLKKLARQALWRLPLSVVLGACLHWFYSTLLLRPVMPALGWAVFVAIVRAFVLFPLYGMMALFGMVFGFARQAWDAFAAWRRKRRGEPGGPSAEGQLSPLQRWLGIPVWFIIAPLSLVPTADKDSGDMPVPVTLRSATLWRWLPVVLAALMFWTRFESEDSGDPVDPYWLAFFASVWVTEHLVLAKRVAPLLRFRRGLPL